MSDESRESTTTRRRALLATGAAAGLTAFSSCLGSHPTSPIQIGFVLPFEGTYGTLGESIVRGFKMRVDQFDGLGGRPVEYVRGPTAATPATGANETRRLLSDENVDIVVGPVSSAVAAEMAPLIDDAGSALWLNPNATNDALVRECATKYHFRTPGSVWHYSAPMGPWVRQKLGDRAVLTYADYAAGQQYAQNFIRGFREAGGTIIEQIPIPLGTDDFRPSLSRLSSITADAIFSFFAGTDAIAYIKQLSEMNITANVTQTGTGFLVSADTLAAQQDAALGTISILNYTPWKQTRRNGDFVTNYDRRYDQIPNTYACDGYDCASVAHRAVEEASTNLTGMINAAEGLQVDSPRGFLKLDGNTHDAIQNMDVREVVRGPEGEPINRVIDTIERQKVPWRCEF